MNIIKRLWVKFWVAIGRCPKCFGRFNSYGDYGIEYGYCGKHIYEAYYDTGEKVKFTE